MHECVREVNNGGLSTSIQQRAGRSLVLSHEIEEEYCQGT